MKDLRELEQSLRQRCEKYVKYHCHCPSPSSCDCLKVAVDNLESFAREIRNEALEEAAKVAESVPHEDDTQGWCVARDIRALAAQTNGKEVENG